MSYLFDLNLQLIADAALMIVAIFVLFLIVGSKLFNPIRSIMEKRQEKIQNELETAASDMEKAKELKAEYEEKNGPLTAFGTACQTGFNWLESPWPWEKEAN